MEEFGGWEMEPIYYLGDLQGYGETLHPYYPDKLDHKLRQELGDIKFVPFSETSASLSDNRKLDIIEFFYKYISKPIENIKNEYDKKAGRYEYTIAVNDLFEQFNHPYKLVKGEIRLTTCKVLDERILSLNITTDDQVLRELIESAVNYFYDRSGEHKKTGLEKIVDAFERLKTLEGTDKKGSIEKVFSKLSPFELVRNMLNQDMRDLTDIANNWNIRHSEIKTKSINDPNVMEYLFYSYFNFVYLILKKYDMLQENEDYGTKIGDDDIPF